MQNRRGSIVGGGAGKLQRSHEQGEYGQGPRVPGAACCRPDRRTRAAVFHRVTVSRIEVGIEQGFQPRLVRRRGHRPGERRPGVSQRPGHGFGNEVGPGWIVSVETTVGQPGVGHEPAHAYRGDAFVAEQSRSLAGDLLPGVGFVISGVAHD